MKELSFYTAKVLIPVAFLIWILLAPEISDWWSVVPLLIIFG